MLFGYANLSLKKSKCAFGYHEIKFLAHIISKEGKRPDPKKLAVLDKFKQPQTVKQIRELLGFTGYYREFIKGYTEIVRPLQLLTCKRAVFRWGERHEKAME